MKVGDLVRDKDWVHTNQLGVIIEVDEYEEVFNVAWNGRGEEWLTEMYLEVISK